MEMNKLHLEQIHLGERKDVDGIEPSQEQLSMLDKSDEEILSKYSVESMRAAVEAKLNARQEIIEFKDPDDGKVAAKVDIKETGKKQHSSFVRFFTIPQNIIITAAAACFALAVPVIILSNQNKAPTGNTLSSTEISDESRVKGNGARLNIYRKDGLEAIKLDSNAKVSEGDTLQISYIAAGAKYGAIISIDGNGTVTQHFPYDSKQCEELLTGSEIALDYSYQLDNAPSFERFLLITSRNPFSTDSVVQKLTDAEKKGNAQTVKLNQDKDISITDILLLK